MQRAKLTRSKAIRSFCYECMGYQRKFINECDDKPCPLWEFRKGPGGGQEETDVPLRAQHEPSGNIYKK